MNSKRKKTKVDLKLLKEVLSIQSKSNLEERMVTYLTNYFNKHNIVFSKDSYGNIYITKGESTTYPCIVAHMDTVHKLIPVEDFKVFDLNNEILYAMDVSIGEQVGIGGKIIATLYRNI
jgi:di/tripeptidase